MLGFLCEKGQCSVDLNQLECFEKMKKPKGQRELASLLGFTNFLQDQIPLYSQVVGPLQQITSKKNWDKDTWGPDQEAAFSRLKTALLKVPVVHQPDNGQGFPRINRRIAARSRSGSLPSGKRGEEVCIVHVESVKERATKLLRQRRESS